jgi:hypothetical protein
LLLDYNLGECRGVWRRASWTPQLDDTICKQGISLFEHGGTNHQDEGGAWKIVSVRVFLPYWPALSLRKNRQGGGLRRKFRNGAQATMPRKSFSDPDFGFDGTLTVKSFGFCLLSNHR